MKEVVILLHGLARTNRSMKGFEKVLIKAGYSVCNIDYPSRKRSIEQLAAFIAEPIEAALKDNQAPVHFVTYSLGALVLRTYLAERALPQLGKIVLIAPPHGGSPVADFLKSHRWFHWFFGPVGKQLGKTAHNPLWHIPSEVPMGIIAGSRSWDPLSFLFKEINDGRVGVSDTKHPDMTDHLVLPLSHFQMAYHQDILTQTEYFLLNGKFNHVGLRR